MNVFCCLFVCLYRKLNFDCLHPSLPSLPRLWGKLFPSKSPPSFQKSPLSYPFSCGHWGDQPSLSLKYFSFRVGLSSSWGISIKCCFCIMDAAGCGMKWDVHIITHMIVSCSILSLTHSRQGLWVVFFVLFVDLDGLGMMYGDIQIQELPLFFRKCHVIGSVNLYERNEIIFKLVVFWFFLSHL